MKSCVVDVKHLSYAVYLGVNFSNGRYIKVVKYMPCSSCKIVFHSIKIVACAKAAA